MKKRHLIGILAVLTAVSTACKDDSETDLITGSSDIKGLYINEVCTSGTDWIELYNGSDSEISPGIPRIRSARQQGSRRRIHVPVRSQNRVQIIPGPLQGERLLLRAQR